MTDLTVAGVDMVPGDSRDAAKMRVTLIGLRSRYQSCEFDC